MTLPPVVGDAEVCYGREDDWRPENGGPVPDMPHEWERHSLGFAHTVYEVCRYCGGRKP